MQPIAWISPRPLSPSGAGARWLYVGQRLSEELPGAPAEHECLTALDGTGILVVRPNSGGQSLNSFSLRPLRILRGLSVLRFSFLPQEGQNLKTLRTQRKGRGGC